MDEPLERAQVLVIDDDSVFLTLMDEILRDAGYRASGWSSSRGAIDRVRRLQPAVVILDLWLEDPAAGWRLLEALDADTGLRHLPVVVCSADSAALHERAAALTRARRRALPKPFDLDHLLETVAALLPWPGGPTFSGMICRDGHHPAQNHALT